VTIVCAWCGRKFERKNPKGPIPRYCRQGCRQRAYEDRRLNRRLLEMYERVIEVEP
jgi:hypothetical protein